MPLDPDPYSGAVIGAAIKIHRALGPGLLEHLYTACLAHELRQMGLRVGTEVEVPVRYDDHLFAIGFRADLIVEQQLVLEIKSVEKLIPVHCAQLRTYLRLCNAKLGLLINFNVPVLKDGITRVVNDL